MTFNSCLDCNLKVTGEMLNLNDTEIDEILERDYELNRISNESIRWRFVKMNVLILLKSDDSRSEFINISMSNYVKKSIEFIVSLGLLPNFKDGFGINLSMRSKQYSSLDPELISMEERCERLKFCVKSLRILYENYDSFRIIILSHYLNDLLTAIIQLMFDFKEFKEYFDWFYIHVHKPIFVKQLMLMQANKKMSMNLRRFLAMVLNRVLSDDFESVLRVVLDSAENQKDVNKWNEIDVLAKLILNKKQQILIIKDQLFNMINAECSYSNRIVRIIALLMKYLWKKRDKNIINEFLNNIRYFLKCFNENLIRSLEFLNKNFLSFTDLIYFTFIYDIETVKALPIILLKDYFNTLLMMFYKTNANCKKLSDIVSRIFLESNINYDELFYQKNNCYVISINVDDKIEITYDQNIGKECLLIELIEFIVKKFINDSDKIEYIFEWLLKKLMQLNCDVEHKIVFLQLMSQFVENKTVISYLKSNPKSLIEFIKEFLEKSIKQQFHRFHNQNDNYQNIFVILMILKTILEQSNCFKDYYVLKNVLLELKTDSDDTELKMLAGQLNDWISEEIVPNKIKNDEHVLSYYEQVLNETFSCKDYVRGHGLIELTKLIQNRDSEACTNQQYLMYLFIQNLKSDESYVYLSAINGLVALSDRFSDVIVPILTDEYLSISDRMNMSDDVRVKLGEALIRISKLLGEMVIKFKTTLIHTFLCGCRHSNTLVRTSSLSNLAEVCYVLNFKLGDTITEILACIQAIILTDKEIEAQRGAVVVLKLLLDGLENEAFFFLKDDILSIYKTLKLIVQSASDQILIHHTVSALKLLDDRTKEFLCPKFNMLKIN